MYTSSWARIWLAIGLLWFLLGIAWLPSNKLYQQGLVAFLWLPALLMFWSGREQLRSFWQTHRVECLAFLGLCAWAALSLLWSTTEEPAREIKRLCYIALFMLAFVLMTRRDNYLPPLLQVAGMGLGLAALLSIVEFYVLGGQPWLARLQGMGGTSHPILGGYVMGAAAVWLLHVLPRGTWLRLLGLLAVACLATFVALTQSRGAFIALAVAVVLMPLWRPGRVAFGAILAILLATLVGFWLFEPLIMSRGASYRPEILLNSMRMVIDAPWGLGLGSDYRVAIAGTALSFDHTHNLPLHLGVQLGWPALAFWAVLWLGALRRAWLSRQSELGQVALVLWIFSSVAMQMDAASLWGTPRAEWFITWLPLALALTLPVSSGRGNGCAKMPGSFPHQ